MLCINFGWFEAYVPLSTRSNCVVNLSPDKRAVLQEAYRVLKVSLMHTHTHTHTHTCMHTRTHTHTTHTHAHTCTHAHTHACTHTHTRTHTHAHTRTHARTHTHAHARAHTHTGTCTAVYSQVLAFHVQGMPKSLEGCQNSQRDAIFPSDFHWFISHMQM